MLIDWWATSNIEWWIIRDLMLLGGGGGAGVAWALLGLKQSVCCASFAACSWAGVAAPKPSLHPPISWPYSHFRDPRHPRRWFSAIGWRVRELLATPEFYPSSAEASADWRGNQCVLIILAVRSSLCIFSFYLHWDFPTKANENQNRAFSASIKSLNKQKQPAKLANVSQSQQRKIILCGLSGEMGWLSEIELKEFHISGIGF